MRKSLFAGLLVLLALPLGIILAQSGGEIAYEVEVTGTITEDDPVHEWTFQGSAGDLVTIEMVATNPDAGNLDSLLQLLSADGGILAENDDASNVTVDSRIDAFPLPENGTYTIIATRFGLESGLSEGDYMLTLRQVTEGDAAGEDLDIDGSLAYGDAVTGSLDRQNFADRWQFVGEEGDVITLRMERSDQNSDLDSFLRLLDDENRELERNDDGPQGISSSQIVGFTLPYSGTYTIVATRFGFESGTSSGGYILVLEAGSADDAPPTEATPEETTEPPAEPSEEPTSEPPTEPEGTGGAHSLMMGYGDFETVEITDRELGFFRHFVGRAGDVVTISVKRGTGNLNPALELRDSSGNTIAENDSFNGSADARIVDVVLPANDTYTIVVNVESGEGEGILHLFSTGTSELPASEPETSEPEETDAPEEAATEEPEEPEESAPPVQEAPDLPDLSEAGLVIILSWDGSADLDLEVRDPDGSFIGYGNTESDSGGVFGGDANGACTGQQEAPAETIYWLDDAPSGDYSINVAYVFPCGTEGPVSYSISIVRDGEEIETITGELDEGGFESHDQTID